MEKRIAIVTGATGGIGREFARQLLSGREAIAIDQLWAIARTAETLASLRSELGPQVVPVAADLASAEGMRAVRELLERERPRVIALVNNAGVARMGEAEGFSSEEIGVTVALNCTAPACLCALCLPFTEAGSWIANVSSASAFQPVPYLSLYGATKAFERSYSRALNIELEERGVTVCAVCPSWVDTELLMREVNGKSVSFPGLVAPERVVAQALRDVRKGRDQSVCPFYAKYLHACAKLLPHRALMRTWTNMLRRYGHAGGDGGEGR